VKFYNSSVFLYSSFKNNEPEEKRRDRLSRFTSINDLKNRERMKLE